MYSECKYLPNLSISEIADLLGFYAKTGNIFVQQCEKINSEGVNYSKHLFTTVVVRKHLRKAGLQWQKTTSGSTPMGPEQETWAKIT